MALWHRGLRMALGKLPKVIKPSPHAVLDYAVVGSFILMSALYWRRNRRAALGCLVCGGATAVNSILTEYPGGVFRAISYRDHGRIDARIAGFTAAVPGLMHFKDEPEARFFGLHALGQTTIVGLTDFDHYELGLANAERGRAHPTCISGSDRNQLSAGDL